MAFKRALFALLLSKVDQVARLPGNGEGVLCHGFVSFFLLCLFFCSYCFFTFPLWKKRKPENYHVPGRDSRHPDSAGVVCRHFEELNYIQFPNYIKCPTIGLVL